MAEIHNYFDGKFLEETSMELTRLIKEAEIEEQVVLSSSQAWFKIIWIFKFDYIKYFQAIYLF